MDETTTTGSDVEPLDADALAEHEWVLMDVTCAACGAVNQIHEQLPEWLAVRHPVAGNLMGVNWECNRCGAKNNLGGEAPLPPDSTVLECETCHSTFAPSKVTLNEDGTWTCRVDSHVNPPPAVAVSGTESAAGAQTGGSL